MTRLYTSCALPVSLFKDFFYYIKSTHFILNESAEKRLLFRHILAWQVDSCALRLNDIKLHLPVRWPLATGLVLWKCRPEIESYLSYGFD